MKGARPLTDVEITAVLGALDGRYSNRDRAMFLLGVRSGFRISEILSLRLSDVFVANEIVSRISVKRSHMKGKIEGRTVVLHQQAKDALYTWVKELLSLGGCDSDFIFKSRNGTNQPISRSQAFKLLEKAYRQLGFAGTLGTRAMRKSFANCVYEKLNRDLVKTQKALGHRNINSTVSYLSFKSEEIDQAILSI